MNNEQRSILEFDVARAKEAQRGKSMFELYFEEREAAIYEEFRRVDTDQGRLVLQVRLTELDNIRDHIDSVINSGKLASQQLER